MGFAMLLANIVVTILERKTPKCLNNFFRLYDTVHVDTYRHLGAVIVAVGTLICQLELFEQRFCTISGFRYECFCLVGKHMLLLYVFRIVGFI